MLALGVVLHLSLNGNSPASEKVDADPPEGIVFEYASASKWPKGALSRLTSLEVTVASPPKRTPRELVNSRNAGSGGAFLYPYVWSIGAKGTNGVGHTLMFHGSFSLPIYRDTAPKGGFEIIRLGNGRNSSPPLPLVSYDLLRKPAFGVMAWPEPGEQMIVLGQKIRDGKLDIITAPGTRVTGSRGALNLFETSVQAYEDDEFSVFAAFAAKPNAVTNASNIWAKAVQVIDATKEESLWNLTHLIATLDPADRLNPEIVRVAVEREKTEGVLARRFCFTLIAWLAGDLGQEVKMKTLASQVAKWPVSFSGQTMTLAEKPVGSDLALANHRNNPQRGLAILKAAASARTVEARLFCLSDLGEYQAAYRPHLLKMIKDPRVTNDTASLNILCETLAKWMPDKAKPLTAKSLQDKAAGWLKILGKP